MTSNTVDVEELREAKLLELAKRQLTISEAVLELNKLWLELYRLTPWQINSGDCELYADCLCEIMPECESFWGDELADETDSENDIERLSYHCITRYRGRYYDSQHPDGVSDFRDMPIFH